MALNKKGFVFTFLATVFVTVLVIIFIYQQPQEMRQEAFLLDTRIISMNDVLADIEEDAGRMLSVSTFRSMVAMQDHMASTGLFFDNVSLAFDELIVNGSINGTNMTVMDNNTFPVWRDRMIAQAAKIGVTLTLAASNTDIQHSSPWDVMGSMTLDIYMIDTTTNTEWTKQEAITSTVSIDQFEDPTYRLNTAGRVTNVVVETNITDFVAGNDTTNLMIHTNNSMYREWTAAPSLLMRYEGRLNESSPYGIESLVDVQELVDNGIPMLSKSIADYIYFSDYDPISCTVDGLPSWWQIDGLGDASNSTQHPYYYEVEGVINPGCT